MAPLEGQFYSVLGFLAAVILGSSNPSKDWIRPSFLSA